MSFLPPGAIVLSVPDALIVLVYLVAITWLGIAIGRGSRDLGDYLLGDRRVPWWAVLGSIVATETSTATFLSVPGLAYAKGGNLGFLQLALGYCAGRILVSVWLLPLYFRGRLFTAYEVLHRRFGGSVQKVASLIFLITRNIGDGLRLFLTAIVVQEVTGADLTVSILVAGLCTTLYTCIGGMKAVIWNDCLQMVIYLVSGVLAFRIIVARLPGGWDQLMEFAISEHKLTVFNPALDFSERHTLWAGLLGGTLLTLGTHGTDQMMVQRYLCTSSEAAASRALICSGFVVFAQFLLFLGTGIALAAFDAQFPLAAEMTNDRRFVHFIVHQMPVGMVGLTIAGVFSAAMSTLSSSLNSSAGAVVSDFLNHDGRPESRLRITQGLTLVFGVVQMSIAIVFAVLHVQESVVNQVLAVAGFSSGILVGVFALGVTTRHVDQFSALVGMLAGVVVLAGVKFGTSVAWPWFSLIGAGTTILAGLLCAAIRGGLKTSPVPEGSGP